MEKIDLFKQFKDQFKQAKKPVTIDTTPAMYLAIGGTGAPGGEVFQDYAGALYSMAFTVKMTHKGNGLCDYVVCKLQCQWFSDLCNTPKEKWQWRMMIRTPDCVEQSEIDSAKEAIINKGKSTAVDSVKKVELIEVDEGKCVQMLHIGPYEKEGDTVAIMQEYMEKNNLSLNGVHHEIYLSDPRRIEPQRLKTILRLPVK